MTRISKLIFFSSFMLLTASAQALDIQVNKEIGPILKEDRILILAPHPDDETIGCAGVIQKAVKTGAQVKVMYLTNGDHNEFAFIIYQKEPILFNEEFIRMGKVREEEAKKAMKILGLNENNLIFLGYPDYGTDTMFLSYWETKRPFSDILTRQSYVPYKESPSYGAPYKAENLLADIKRVLTNYKPNKIFVSHPADVNGDHWAYYCFLQVALQDLKKIIPEPKLYVYLVHAPGWPLPRHHHPNLAINPRDRHFPEGMVDWYKLKLTPEEKDKKYKAMLCYRSQTCVSAFYLLSFVRSNELFGDYPLIVLKKQSSSENNDRVKFFQDAASISYAVVNNYLWVRVKKPPQLKNRLVLNFYLLGYNTRIPFAEMLNIWVATKYNKFKMYEMNQGKEIDPKDTSLELKPKYLILKVPLSVLKDPSFLQACVYTTGNFLSLEAMGFRRINIQE